MFINNGNSAPVVGLTTMIVGGTGGVGGDATAATDPGAGVLAWGGVVVVTDGAIDGGSTSVQADSVLFSGGGNELVLEPGATFIGHIVSTSGDTNDGDLLVLAGSTNASLNAGLIQGFAYNIKTGSDNWTLTGTGNAGIDWTIQQGELTGASNAFDGDLTFVSNGLGTPSRGFRSDHHGHLCRRDRWRRGGDQGRYGHADPQRQQHL
ncbi:hypothetical protein [Dyella sp. M7H15-1]|uniref:hypothetical protein n=1 Tax=Dyella sp. M7H15-1 TaxID=2501295 RepID=UPI0013E8E5B9|nr:hypothetical protein [Dyella sp. M7H15-1]